MATKVIKTDYSVTVTYPSSSGYDVFNFDTLADLKLWLGQWTAHTGSNATYGISKRQIIWDDSTKYISSTVTQLSAGDI